MHCSFVSFSCFTASHMHLHLSYIVVCVLILYTYVIIIESVSYCCYIILFSAYLNHIESYFLQNFSAWLIFEFV